VNIFTCSVAHAALGDTQASMHFTSIYLAIDFKERITEAKNYLKWSSLSIIIAAIAFRVAPHPLAYSLAALFTRIFLAFQLAYLQSVNKIQSRVLNLKSIQGNANPKKSQDTAISMKQEQGQRTFEQALTPLITPVTATTQIPPGLTNKSHSVLSLRGSALKSRTSMLSINSDFNDSNQRNVKSTSIRYANQHQIKSMESMHSSQWSMEEFHSALSEITGSNPLAVVLDCEMDQPGSHSLVLSQKDTNNH
jgi:hypothetical protein